ncbi:hypothetical protein [Nesterenkonia rhizosphaerae]|uniref:Fibronectin type-III domain-containing protein n=1 Tax=Nesterenkonia rhizosphaerae TaxID=1348272 RepID=A0ABP9G012_9MICC
MKLHRDERGAVDLLSVLMGTLIAGIVAASAIGLSTSIIPAQQDDAAQARLRPVASAQSDLASSGQSYRDYQTLGVSGGDVDVVTNDTADCWSAVSASATGRVFYAESSDPTPRQLTEDTVLSCATPSQVSSMLDTVGRPDLFVSHQQRLDRPAGFSAPVRVGQSALYSVSWTPVPGAVRYQVERRIEDGWDSITTTDTTTSFPTAPGESVTLRVTALAGAGGLDSLPSVHTVTFDLTEVYRNSFESGAGHLMQLGRLSALGEFVTDSDAAVIAPPTSADSDPSPNPSTGALHLRHGQAARTTKFAVTSTSQIEMTFDGRLAAAIRYEVSWMDSHGEPISVAAVEVLPRHALPGENTVELSHWHSYKTPDTQVLRAPENAEFAQVTLIGSGTTASRTAQLDNLRIRTN